MPYPFNRLTRARFADHSGTRLTAEALLAGILALTYLTAYAAAPDVFRWRDERGRVHYGDRSVPGAERLRLAPMPASGGMPGGRVVKVYDGDTIGLDNGDKIRLLGINTPEVDHRGKPAEAGAEAAKGWLTERLAGRSVRLESDVTAHDKYGRRLAHVFLADGSHVNLDLVRKGLASTDIFPPDLKYVDALLAAEREAQHAGRGLWGMAAYQPKPAGAGGEAMGWQRLLGTVETVATGKRQARLRLREPLEVHIPNEDLYLFPPLETYLRARVEVRGWVSRRRGQSSVTVRHPGALVKLE